MRRDDGDRRRLFHCRSGFEETAKRSVRFLRCFFHRVMRRGQSHGRQQIRRVRHPYFADVEELLRGFPCSSRSGGPLPPMRPTIWTSGSDVCTWKRSKPSNMLPSGCGGADTGRLAHAPAESTAANGPRRCRRRFVQRCRRKRFGGDETGGSAGTIVAHGGTTRAAPSSMCRA